ncbi:precorrin-3B C(17)-methyltransferase [Synechococcus sp. CS-1328]|uniref:precorrin-3B C(17)-methyltransferase n=1 Tax=Synechococcus sp. CS-1328 TaxID=2847976 RepID=UPI00223B7ADA|nr:precorrin-3B C(17)-methyltransferase [Synechococcus sp. CS-1328]MCT0225450.1 precorrin-3B C(17)-methyltransferase [Synechococcus sp. CS-1328]
MNLERKGPVLGLGFSEAARPLLAQLQQAGLVDRVRLPGTASMPGLEPGEGTSAADDASDPALWLRHHWDGASAVVAVGACGLAIRLVAPLLQDKISDPAVVVLDPQGRFAIPLLGGHAGGGEALSHRLAALLGGQAVVTGASSGQGRLALDSFGTAWGWRRGSGDWTRLMQRACQTDGGLHPHPGSPLLVRQDCGETGWAVLEASQALGLQMQESQANDDSGDRDAGIETTCVDTEIQSPRQQTTAEPSADLWITPYEGLGCRWHPPTLWLGIGCERNTSSSLLERLVTRGLSSTGLAREAVAGLGSIDRKGDEPALLELAERHGWSLRLFEATALDAVAVPNPSPVVAGEMGTASVAEASALLAAEAITPWGAASSTHEPPAPRLLLTKTIEKAGPGESGAATLAIAFSPRQSAPARGRLELVGSGPGSLDLLTPDARRALAEATIWVGYGLYLDLLEPLRRPDQQRIEGKLTEERQRCATALELAGAGLPVALISSGDSGIYGMAGLALELWGQLPSDQRPAFAVHPGISALQLAAARCGAPLMHDFCTISLSDRLTPWAVIERRLGAAAAGDFVVALYNPRSRGRDWQLDRARELLLQGRPKTTPVALARQLGRAEEAVSLHTLGDLPVEQVDMLTLVLVGNSSSYVCDGRMVTPRGYPGAELS